jgi:hypothetical protein
MPWIACLLVVAAADLPSEAIRGNRHGATSANFRVTNRHPGHDAMQIAQRCEQWRAALQDYWCEEQTQQWSPRCDVVVHANRASYLAAVGAGASQTFGSSYIEFAKNKQIRRRQIDFRGDSEHGAAAVPHELTHVVLVDLLDGRQPPRWADEGMAMLADSAAKRQLHERDLQAGLAQRTTFRAVELLTLDSYPHPSRVPAFYGQSRSLTAFLVLRNEPTAFVAFLRKSAQDGYDAALRDCYAIENVQELEQLWRANLAAKAAHPPANDLAASAGPQVFSEVAGTE